MRTQFPETLEAAMAAEKSQWKIGEALLREADDDYAGKRGLRAVAEELEANGIDYVPSSLARLRATANAFPRNRRHDLPFEVHAEAGEPDTLDVIVKVAAKTKQKVTKWYVRDALRDMRETARETREAVKAAAERERIKAKSEEQAAQERLRKAKDSEREQAKRERDAATERRRKADEKVKQAKTAPRKKDLPPPAEDDVAPMVAKSGVLAKAGQARRLARESEKLLGRHVADLSEAAIAGLTDAAMEAANAWIEVANLVRKGTSNKRSHLRVVNE